MEVLLKIPNSDSNVKEETCLGSNTSKNDLATQEITKDNYELESTKTEIVEVQEENERLRTMLEKVENDYKSLQLRFFDVMQQEGLKKRKDVSSPNRDSYDDESEFVSLSLGRSNSIPIEVKKDEKSRSSNRSSRENEELTKASLTLGFTNPSVVQYSSPENSVEPGSKEEVVVGGETWPPIKGTKIGRSGDDEVAVQQNHVKKARVCVRARCDTPTMNDGCQWRKYGQKTAKGNPCPRAYYRCTVAPGCPVRKHVQRCAEDMSILITTYEGNHNHPLPISATAMASTTSSAASMLYSGASTTASADINRLNFNLYDTSATPPQFYTQPNNTYSPYTHPTVTLDLTTPQFNTTKLTNFNSPTQRFPPTSFDFSDSLSNIRYSNYNSINPNTRPHFTSSGKDSELHLSSPYMDKTKQQLQSGGGGSGQVSFTETLTKAITSDPSFQSVIAAAISSMVGPANGTQSEQSGSGAEGTRKNSAQNSPKVVSNQQSNGLGQSNQSPYSIFKGGSCLPSLTNKEQKK